MGKISNSLDKLSDLSYLLPSNFSAADDKVLNFPPPSSKNYALQKTNMPELSEFTVCSWAQSNDKDSKGYFFSLATGKGDAANQIALSALNSLNVAVKSSFQQTMVCDILF